MTTEARTDDDAALLHEVVEHATHLLPAQGPIAVFVHHNTLHAFEHLPFHEAVARAADIYETEPYLTEARFRELFRSGRIGAADVEAELAERWRQAPPAAVGPIAGRDLERLALLCGVEEAHAATIRWKIEEGDALRRIRVDVPSAHRRRLLGVAMSEADALQALWIECNAKVIPVRGKPSRRDSTMGWTLRDLLLEVTGEDANDLVHPILSRLAAAFLDDGTAAWAMPGREQGFFAAWAALTSSGAAPLPGWMHRLHTELPGEPERPHGATATVLAALAELGIAREDWEPFLTRLLLHLRGWAGMFHWLESHPSHRLSQIRPVHVLDFLAVRLTYDRRAWAHLAHKHLGFSGSLSELMTRLRGQLSAEQRASSTNPCEVVWRLFQLAQLLGLSAAAMAELDAGCRAELLSRLDAFDDRARRRLWQEAFERHYRDEVLAALAVNQRQPEERRRPAQPKMQIVCCIDEREEALRRHIEEAEPQVETFGTAGFFGLAMEYAGIDDGHPSPLCPIVVTPNHVVREVAVDTDHPLIQRRHQRRRRLHRLRHHGRHATQTLLRGTLATPFLGVASAFVLPAYVFAPRLTSRLRETLEGWLLPAPKTRLEGARRGDESAPEPANGFTLPEKIARVAATLENIGLREGFARIVCVLGHGSVSVNNPHESAHDCGACGGRHGGANARLFADFANRPAVRLGLRGRGIRIPDDTIFVGGIHNTSSDAITLYDLDRVPLSHRGDLGELRRVLDHGRALSAHERCRRFESAPRDATPQKALRHVEARAEALSEPRPELGHCTNASCIVGRRSLTRNLFLDRRAFLVSYDPTEDPSGAILERTLAAVGPVGAGISLEYYFSFVDGSGYGCGTKLPHNLVGMLGVMDGPSGDLRTGLPKQMIEVHEAMRLLLIVEAETATLDAIAARQEEIRRLVVNQWIQLVSLSPSRGEWRRWTPSGWEVVDFAASDLPQVASSPQWYAGATDFLPPARITASEVSHAA